MMTINSAYTEIHDKVVSNARGGHNLHSPVNVMLKFFEDSPLKAELEKIIELYKNGMKNPVEKA